MDNDIRIWLYDIASAINEIDSFFDKGEKKFENFRSNLKTKRAIERNLEIIGEAVKRILERDSQFKLTNARKIVDTRNRIIHGYDSVSDDVIWGIVINHLPKLKTEVDKLLNN
jgi:uncharacterized protein with HEPN domain